MYLIKCCSFSIVNRHCLWCLINETLLTKNKKSNNCIFFFGWLKIFYWEPCRKVGTIHFNSEEEKTIFLFFLFFYNAITRDVLFSRNLGCVWFTRFPFSFSIKIENTYANTFGWTLEKIFLERGINSKTMNSHFQYFLFYLLKTFSLENAMS